MHSAEPAAIAALSLASVALLLLARRRRAPKRFAGFDETVPESTRKALEKHRWLPLRHKVLKRQLSPAMLEGMFDDIVRTFTPQQVDYSNTAYGKDHWQLSCFMEYSNGVATGKVNLEAGRALASVCAPIIAQCDATFLDWYNELHPLPKGATRTLSRLQSFVTRYTSTPDETHLPRHIDGAAVDGSLVLGLPTYERFTGGGLTVWDGEGDAELFEYPVGCGDVCLLDSKVWHQSNPVTWGERWVLVIFYRVLTEPRHRAARPPAAADAGEAAQARSQAVRELLASRVLEAANAKRRGTAAR